MHKRDQYKQLKFSFTIFIYLKINVRTGMKMSQVITVIT